MVYQCSIIVSLSREYYRSGGAQFSMAETLTLMAQPLLAISAINGFPRRALPRHPRVCTMAETLIFLIFFNVSAIISAIESCTDSYVNTISSGPIPNNASAISFHSKNNG